MVKKKKASFDKVWKSIQQADINSGFFLLQNLPKKKTLKEKFFQLTLPTHVFFVVVFIASTLVVTKFKLFNIIICLSLFSSFLCLYCALAKLTWNKNTFRDLLSWCEGLYDVEKKIPAMVQEIAEKHLVAIENRSLKMQKWLKFILYVDLISISVGVNLISLLLPDNIYPKFSLAIPVYLPFEEQHSWLAFGTTVLAQTIVSIQTATLAIFLFNTLFCVVIHIFGIFDIIEEFLGQIKKEMLTTITVANDTEPKASSSTLQMDVLETINRSSVMVDKKMPFEVWMQIVTDMVSDVNSTITSFSALFSEIFLMHEITSLCALFLFGLVITVNNQQYLFAIGLTFIPCIHYSLCLINEKILDKFDNIKDMLYDLPWYDLNVKQIKMIMMVMNCDKIQTGFTAAHTHNFTVERFGIVMKAGYTNLLVLKDLIMK